MPPFLPPAEGPFPFGFKPTAGLETLPKVLTISPNSDRLAGGTPITITGLRFGKNADGSSPTVLIGGLAATSVVVVNSQSLTAVTPTSTTVGLVDVSVTVGSQTGTLFGGFTYIGGSIPTLLLGSSIAPPYGPIAGGTPVVITGFNFVTGSTITFGGIAATSVAFMDTEHFSCVTPAHAQGYVDVVITEPSTTAVTLRNGFKYTSLARGFDIRRTPGIRIEDGLNNIPNTCTFRIKGESQPPSIGELFHIVDPFDGGRLLFAGNAQSFKQIYEEKPENLSWDVTCVDFTWQLGKYRPFGTYTKTSVSEIVKDLVARYAVGFTSVHVQTNLAKISISFNGDKNLPACLSELAQAIGGGHWYVDYLADVHFFHVIPPSLTLPAFPQSDLHLGPGTAMTVSEGAQIPAVFSYSIGQIVFATTGVYDNGVETAFSPLSNWLAVSGRNTLSFAGVPVYPPIGSATCLKRRIYYAFNGLVGAGLPPPRVISWSTFAEIPENTTTSFTTWFHALGGSVPLVTPTREWKVPTRPYVPPPPGADSPPVGSQTSETTDPITWTVLSYPLDRTSVVTEGIPYSYTPGKLQFKSCYFYRDGTLSLPSPPSATLVVDGKHTVAVNNVVVGPPINGVDVIARFIFVCWIGVLSEQEPAWSPETVSVWFIIPDNITTQAVILPCLASSRYSIPVNPADTGGLPIFPNPDGPSLETGDAPQEITDSNTLILHNTPLVVTVEASQIRNRIYIFGSGSVLIADPALTEAEIASGLAAKAGGTQVFVADLSQYTFQGGSIRINHQLLRFTGISDIMGSGAILLSPETPLTDDVFQGDVVINFLQIDDVVSQQQLGAVQTDVNGNATDGIYEYTIIDGSLKTPFDLYMRGYAEIEMFGRPIISVDYSTRDPSLSGKIVRFNRSRPPCVGDFLIQTVSIDQIHDASDVLTPRYKVRASSTKFELTDLLLKLFQQSQSQSSAPTSFRGVATTNPQLGENIPLPTSKTAMWTVLDPTRFGTALLPLLTGFGWATSYAVGGPSSSTTGVTDADGYWFRLTAGFGSGSPESRLEMTQAGNGWINIEQNGRMVLHIRTGSSIGGVGGIRLYVGLVDDKGSFPNSDSLLSSGKGVGVRYSSSADKGWVGWSANGSAIALTPVITSIAPSTEYVVSIELQDGQVICNINGAQQIFSAPSLGNLVLIGCLRLYNNTTGTRILDWNATYGERA